MPTSNKWKWDSICLYLNPKTFKRVFNLFWLFENVPAKCFQIIQINKTVSSSVCSRSAPEAIRVMMEYFCSEAMIILVSLWFLCKLKWCSDEANMQMRTTPYGNIRRCLPATANTMSAVPLFSTHFIRQDVLAIMCDFVLANEIEMIATARPRDEDTWDGGWHLAETRPCTFELLW